MAIVISGSNCDTNHNEIIHIYRKRISEVYNLRIPQSIYRSMHNLPLDLAVQICQTSENKTKHLIIHSYKTTL